MADEPAGRISLGFQIKPGAVEREANKAGGIFQKTIGRSLDATQNAVKNAVSAMVRGGRDGARAFSGVVTEADALQSKLDSINARLDIQRARLGRLQEQYSLLYEMGAGGGDRGLKLQNQIAQAEYNILSLTQRSDQAAQALWKIDDALTSAGDSGSAMAAKAVPAVEAVGETAKKTGGFIRNMGRMFDRAFRRVFRQVLLIAVLYKGLRGLLDYMGKALKQNEAFTKSLSIIRTNLQVAFQPILKTIMPALTVLIRGLATATTYLASFVAALFGMSYQEAFNAAKAIQDIGKAAEKAKRSLLGFDEIHILGDTKTGGEEDEPLTMPDTEEAESWASRFVAILQPTLDALGRLWEALKPFAQTIGKGLLAFWKDVMVPFGEWLLETALPWLIDRITDALTKLTTWARENPAAAKTMFQLILAFLAGLWLYNTTYKIVTFLGGMVTAFKTWASAVTIAGMAANLAAIGFAALIGGVLLIAANWSKMNGIERTIAILGAVAIAAATAAAAVGALQSAWSLGIAAAAIVAGIAAIGYAISAANKRAQEGLGQFNATGGGGGLSSTKTTPRLGAVPLATGGIVTQPTLAMIGERSKKEAVLPLEGDTGWMDMLAGKIASIVQPGGGGSGQPLELVLKIDGAELGRASVRSIKDLQRQTGKDLLLGVT